MQYLEDQSIELKGYLETANEEIVHLQTELFAARELLAMHAAIASHYNINLKP
jgi:hypothetical protein